MDMGHHITRETANGPSVTNMGQHHTVTVDMDMGPHITRETGNGPSATNMGQHHTGTADS